MTMGYGINQDDQLRQYQQRQATGYRPVAGTPDPSAGIPGAVGRGTFNPTAGNVWAGIGQSSGPGGQRYGTSYPAAQPQSGMLGGRPPAGQGSVPGGGFGGGSQTAGTPRPGGFGGLLNPPSTATGGMGPGVPTRGVSPQQGNMPDPQGQAYTGAQYRWNPQTGQYEEVTLPARTTHAGITGYDINGNPTYARQQWTAAQTGMLGGQQTLGGRQQTLSEQLGLGNLSIASAAQRLDELVRTGQLSLQQRNQALQELQNAQQYGLQQGGLTGYYGGQQTLEGELGRGNLSLAQTQADRDWYYRQASLQANPANYALVAALGGQAPWQQALTGAAAQAQGGGQPFNATREIARQSAPNMASRLNPSERAAFGSALGSAGTTWEDYQQEARRWQPTAGGFRVGGFR